MAAKGKGEGGRRSLNFNVGILGHIDSGKTSLGMLCKHLQHCTCTASAPPVSAAKVLSSVASTASFDKNPQSRERGITLDLGKKNPLSLPSVTKLCLCLSFSLPGFSSFSMPVPAHLEGTSSSLTDRHLWNESNVCLASECESNRHVTTTANFQVCLCLFRTVRLASNKFMLFRRLIERCPCYHYYVCVSLPVQGEDMKMCR